MGYRCSGSLLKSQPFVLFLFTWWITLPKSLYRDPLLGNHYLVNRYIGNPYTGNPCIAKPYTGIPYVGILGFWDWACLPIIAKLLVALALFCHREMQTPFNPFMRLYVSATKRYFWENGSHSMHWVGSAWREVGVRGEHPDSGVNNCGRLWTEHYSNCRGD